MARRPPRDHRVRLILKIYGTILFVVLVLAALAHQAIEGDAFSFFLTARFKD